MTIKQHLKPMKVKPKRQEKKEKRRMLFTLWGKKDTEEEIHAMYSQKKKKVGRNNG